MSALVKLFEQKYGGRSKEAAGLKNLPPQAKAKFEANKKNPPGPAGGPGTGAKKEGSVKLGEFEGGGIASKSFFEELDRLNAEDLKEIRKQAMLADPLVQKIRSLA